MQPLCVCGVFLCACLCVSACLHCVNMCVLYGWREAGQSGALQCSRTAFLSSGNFP